MGHTQGESMTETPAMPAYDALLRRMAEAEHGPGWFAACVEAGQYLVPSRSLIDTLAAVLGELSSGSGGGGGSGAIVEVCTGDGTLATALCEHDLEVIATDSHPPTDAPVERLDAEAALHRHQPRIVLGSFVPWDAGVNEAVLNSPSVQHYLLLHAMLSERDRIERLAKGDALRARRLPEVERWMLTRHDVWMGPNTPPRTKGQAWVLSRTALETDAW